ncbi:hypothetical protein JW887_03110 [Candidatus Dojkabacteria bacterium]|nr:hypothetical protein [Candidatus Dojkabacteria bacterium]
MEIYIQSNKTLFSRAINDISKKSPDKQKNIKFINIPLIIQKLGLFPKIYESDDKKILGVADPHELGWDLSSKQIKSIRNLKSICTKSSYIEYIDLKLCREKRISVKNNPGINSQSVAEYAIWMMLSLARRLPQQINNKFVSEYDEKDEQTEISGKTAGIFGLGKIGSRIAKMSKGLGMKVIYWSRKSREKNYKYVAIEKLMKTSDFIFNCLDLNKDTMGFFNQELLKLMKSNAYFISVMGGMGYGIEDNDYLCKAVIKGKIAGFSIEKEHEKNYKIMKIPAGTNIFIPSSLAFFTKEANERAYLHFIENICEEVKKS